MLGKTKSKSGPRLLAELGDTLRSVTDQLGVR